ncbi:MAG: hypothetical protein ACP5I4_09775 [Oceanipulchritudo sp.]
MELLGLSNYKELTQWKKEQIQESLEKTQNREECWTSAVAVGDRPFLNEVASRLGLRAQHRDIVEKDSGCALMEPPGAYSFNSMAKRWV